MRIHTNIHAHVEQQEPQTQQRDKLLKARKSISRREIKTEKERTRETTRENGNAETRDGASEK